MKSPSITKQSFPNVYQSELYREFERRAFKNGMIDTPGLLIKTASEKINAKKDNNLNPSDSLENDILRLASFLRKKGYEENAEKIEQNFVIFKKAEAEFYNLKLESPQDFLDASHDIVDQSDLHFHDINEISKAINQMSEKEPNGKQAKASIDNISDIAFLAKQIKIAQETDPTKPFQKSFDTWNQYIDFLVSTTNEIQEKSANFFNFEKLADKDSMQSFLALNGNKNVKDHYSKIYRLYQLGDGKIPTLTVILQNQDKIKELMGGTFDYEVLDQNKSKQNLTYLVNNNILVPAMEQTIQEFAQKNHVQTSPSGTDITQSIEDVTKRASYSVAMQIYNVMIVDVANFFQYINNNLATMAKQIGAMIAGTKINMENQVDNEFKKPDLEGASNLAKTVSNNLLKIIQNNSFKYLSIVGKDVGADLSQETLLNQLALHKNDLLMGIVGGGSVDISDVNQKIDEAISSIYPMYKQNNPGAKDQYDKYLKPAKYELDNLPGSQNVKSQNDFIKFLSTHGYDIKTGKTTLLKDLQDIIDLSNTKAK